MVPDEGMTKPRTGRDGFDLQLLPQLRREDLGELHHRGEAHIRLVDPIPPDGLVIGHLHKRRAQLNARTGLERAG